jgi:hypothetical protein
MAEREPKTTEDSYAHPQTRRIGRRGIATLAVGTLLSLGGASHVSYEMGRVHESRTNVNSVPEETPTRGSVLGLAAAFTGGTMVATEVLLFNLRRQRDEYQAQLVRGKTSES